jgi:hypothetical protein
VHPSERRRYVRHPIRVPLAVRPRGSTQAFFSRVADLSEGGLSFGAPLPVELGTILDIELPVHHSRFKLTGTVASCMTTADGSFRVGLSFGETDVSFKMKLAEQVLRIEELRATLSRERGTEVSTQEASELWVEQFASSFADLYERPLHQTGSDR